MNETRTSSILQRLPVILAVTAASYGLPLQSQAHRLERSTGLHGTAANTSAAAGIRGEMRQTAAMQS